MLRKTLTILSVLGLVVLLAWPSRQSGRPPSMWDRIPDWILMALFLLFAVILTTCAVWPRRPKLGLCVKCGYDLRASEDRCPECGEEFSR